MSTELTKKSISNGIRKLREVKGLTQEELAYKVGMKISYVTKLEASKHFPRVDTMYRIAKAFEITLTELLSFIIQDGKPPKKN